MKILLSVALLLAGAAPALSDDALGPPPTLEHIAAKAQADPAGYREVLINCAAFHGLAAISAGDDAVTKEAENAIAITLLTAAGMAVPDESEAANEQYTSQLWTLKLGLDADTTGQVEKDLVNLGQACAPVEPYAKQQVADAMAEEAAAAAADEAPAP